MHNNDILFASVIFDFKNIILMDESQIKIAKENLYNFALKINECLSNKKKSKIKQ